MKIQALIIHHSYSNWGDAKAIDSWHKSNGWKGIGYHKVILNGYPTYAAWAQGKKQNCDGIIQQGRPDTEPGAHCTQEGMNSKSLGICLIGNFDADLPTAKQWAALVDCCARLCKRHGLTAEDIYPHCHFATYKSCPGRRFDMDKLKAEVVEKLKG